MEPSVPKEVKEAEQRAKTERVETQQESLARMTRDYSRIYGPSVFSVSR